jgi:transcriptional regulator with XRE-family HTH domain
MGTRRRRPGLAAARKSAGYTQEGLAEALFVDRSTVIRWEAGLHAPVPYLWPKLARLLGVTRERLVVLLTVDEPAHASPTTSSMTSQPVALEDMKRRTLMKWGMATTAAASLSGGAGTSVGLADVQRLQRAAARLHGLDQRHGGDTLWQAALIQAHDGAHLLEQGSYTETVGRLLLTATGQLQICAGWLALDAGQHEVARGCFGEALAMSRQANDPKIETRALANLAYQSNLLDKPREAQRYAYGAEQAATGSGAPPWLAAIPQLRLAASTSRTGNARDADHAVGQARRVLDRDNDTSSEEWSAFLSSSEIDGIEATCAIELGRPPRRPNGSWNRPSPATSHSSRGTWPAGGSASSALVWTWVPWTGPQKQHTAYSMT